jgi:hypothetical protein
MKSFVRKLVTVGLVSGTILASSYSYALQALALTQEQILQKLNQVPVFTFANPQGDILLGKGENNKKVAYLFISQQEAQKAVQEMSQKNPGQKLQVLPLPLGQMYKAVTEGKDKPDTPVLNLVPVDQQVKSAVTVLTQENPQQQVKEFPGVPLFFAIINQDKKEAYLTYQEGQQTVIPLFFEKESLQKLVEQFKKQKPELASSIQMRVVSLEQMIGIFQKENDQAVGYMQLIPSQESIQFILNSQQQQPNKPSQPAPNK